MKIAILHSAIVEGNNGAEVYVYEMAKQFKSKIYICDYNERVESSLPGIEKMVVVKRIEHPTSFSRMYLEMMRVQTNRDDIDEDFLIYSTSPPCFRVRKDPTPYLHLCHTPERGFFDLKDMIMERLRSWGFPKYQIAYLFYKYREHLDYGLFTKKVNPKQVITNSKLIMDRYENAYGKRPRRAVGAPIRTSLFRSKGSEDFYFTAGGLRENKRVDWQIRALAKTKERLVIAGDGPERKNLEKLAKKLKANVEFLGRVEEQDLIDNYSRCKAFIFSAKDEDFGMVPLEAMASGKPVICVNEGGPIEYLDESTSFLYEDIKGLTRILKSKSMDDYTAMKKDCIERAKEFDSEVVANRIRAEIKGIKKEFY